MLANFNGQADFAASVGIPAAASYRERVHPMPKTESHTSHEVQDRPENVSVREARFDPAHEFPRGEAQAVSAIVHEQPATTGPVNAAALDIALAESDEGVAFEVIQQFRLQAQQLAEHL